MRLSEDYIACCETDGAGRLSDLYSDFGDVRSADFKSWWTEKKDGVERGASLFAEPNAEESVQILKPGSTVLYEPDVIAVQLPMYLPKRFIEKRLKQIIGSLHKGRRGVQNAKRSRARYTYRGQPNVPALAMAFTVYAYRQANPKKKLWEIGNEIPKLLVGQKVDDGMMGAEQSFNKRVLAASVSRYLRRAATMIKNAERGLFP